MASTILASLSPSIAVCVAVVGCVFGCSQGQTACPTIAQEAPIQPTIEASATSPSPVIRPAVVTSMPVAGFGAAVVDLPTASAPRPLVVAIHAHNVRPEKACANWRMAIGDGPILACPLGVPIHAAANAPVTVGSVEFTAREVVAVIEQVRRTFLGAVAQGPVVLTGYSLGAKVSVSAIPLMGDQVELAVLGEGGYDDITRSAAAALASHRLRRVLLLCSTRACECSFAPAAKHLASAGIDVRVVTAGAATHPFDGAVVQEAQRAWPWLVRDDTRFAITLPGAEESLR